MAWHIGKQEPRIGKNFNEIAKGLKGNLDDVTTRITLGKFLQSNIGLTWEMLSGLKLMEIQELILKGLFINDNSLIVGGRGFSKCKSEDSLCLTNKGIIPLRDVSVGDDIFAINTNQKVLAKTVNPESNGLFFQTKSGYTSKVKLGHQFLIWDKINQVAKYELAENLTIDDYLIVRKSPDYWSLTEEDNDWFYYLGLVVGDGHVKDNLVSITTADHETISFLVSFYQKHNIYYSIKQRGNHHDIRIFNRLFIKKLKSYGITVKLKAHLKPFPLPVLKYSKNNISHFISALFDTDGYAVYKEFKNKNSHHGYIGFTSTSLDLIQKTQTILLNYGIRSWYYVCHKGGRYKVMNRICNTQVAYTLRISGYSDIRKFSQLIGFQIKRKQFLVNSYLQNNKNFVNNDPNEIPGLNEYLYDNYNPMDFRNAGVRLYKKVSISKAKKIRQIGLLTEEDNNKLDQIFKNDLIFEKISKIEKIRVKTIDIQVDKEQCYWSDGFINHNSWLISVFSMLYTIFNPDKKICLISANFRSSRRILEQCDKFLKGRKASLLRACYTGDTSMKRGNDIVSWKMSNGAEIFALPLSNGEGLRGTRANCVLVDEGLLISQEIQETILRPFLTVKQDFREEQEIRTAEDFLISEGIITEEDRISFPKNKFCIFSSASYEFQYLYSLYSSYLDYINNPEKVEVAPGDKRTKYFVVRASYEALPANGIMDLSQINAAKAGGGENTEYFKREYRALFSKTGEGFYSALKLHRCTVPLLEYPTVQLKGEKDAEYILTIDTAYSAAKNADHFAMSVSMLIPQQRKLILVHNYAVAGAELKDHYNYFAYLMKFFNIVFICMDGSGTEFIHGFNESVIGKEANLNLKFLDVDFCSDEYLQEITKAKNQYNQTAGKIIYAQTPTAHSNRLMNEHMQNQIDSEKIWFGSKLGANENEVKKYQDFKLPIKPKDKNDQEMGLIDFISFQDEWIDATKTQVALIECKSSALGSLSYDLPQNLKRETGAHRTRKDSYMCLLLACWGARHFYEMRYREIEPINASFEPIFIS